jgi:hypothetical protein
MCNPAVAVAVVQLIGTAVGAKGQRDAGRASAQIAEGQAQLADFSARDAVSRGKIEEQLYRRDVKQLQGSQRVAIAGSGFDSGGDLAQLASQTAAMGEFGAMTIRTNALREAYGYKLEGKAQVAQSRYARKAGDTNSMATLLTGAAQSYGTYRSLS